MPITDNQRAARSEHLGSSDLPALLGVSPWATAYDLWLDKTNQITLRETTPAMRTGQYLEDGLIAWAADTLGVRVKRNQPRVAGVIKCHIDALTLPDNVPIEAKVSWESSQQHSEWGDPWSDQVPDHVLVQCHGHMIVTDQDRAYVPALLWGELRMYVVRRSDDLAKLIVERAEKFWSECVQGGKPPNAPVTLDVIKRARTAPARTVVLDPELVRQWRGWKKITDVAGHQADLYRARVLKALMTTEGLAEQGIAKDVGGVTYREVSATRFDASALRADHPELYDQYVRPAPYRRLWFRKPKHLKETNHVLDSQISELATRTLGRKPAELPAPTTGPRNDLESSTLTYRPTEDDQDGAAHGE